MAETDNKEHRHFRDHIPEEARMHARNAREEMCKGWAAFFPPEYIARRRRARKEMLLAARELINHALDRLESYETRVD